MHDGSWGFWGMHLFWWLFWIVLFVAFFSPPTRDQAESHG